MRTRILALAGLLLALSSALASEVVMLTPTDGKAISGELIKANRDQVVLKVGEGDAANETVFSWDKIKKISNGLTREKILQEWAKENPEKVCADCKGEGKVICPKCNGKSFLVDQEKVACTKCAGTGLMPCSNFACKLGKIPCDGDCLKPTEGNWVKGKDNLLWRRFVYPGGFAEWSEHHYGEVIKMQAGRPVNLGKCPKCQGTLKMNCPVCGGKVTIACTACKGTKMMVPNCPDCKDGKIVCPSCKGTGEKAPKQDPGK